MKEEIKSLLAEHKINPFLDKINFEQHNMLNIVHFFDVVDTYDNVYQYHNGQYTNKKYDNEFLEDNYKDFKFYKEGNFFNGPHTILYDRDIILQHIISGELCDKSCRILLYILAKIGKNSTSVKLNRKLLADDLGYKSNDYSVYLKKLVKAGYIAKKDDSEYWINPNFFFHGKRYEHFMNRPLYNEFGLENYDRSSGYIDPKEVILGREIITRGSAYRLEKDIDTNKWTPKYLCELQHNVENTIVEDKFEYYGFKDGVNLDIQEKVDSIRNKYKKIPMKKKPRKSQK